MSSDGLAISVRDLGKCYHIYERPSDRLKQFIVPRARKLLGQAPSQHFREFWALRDVSLEIRAGESVGVIGRNGSGKSTLLQIICGTLSPTLGNVETNGRIAALLELGSGFNPEFSGRDNVYLNAALLGLNRDETERRFDSIAAFADVGDHLDQPVKTYSSGMFVRLAFAVIAHVDADILIVDEALSVGDAIFTQRCMRFIRRFQERGTLLFVSHDSSAIQNLCRSVVWLDRGRVREVGSSKTVSESYLRYSLQAVYGDKVGLEEIEVSPEAPPASRPDEGRPPERHEAPEGALEAPVWEPASSVPDGNGSLTQVKDNLAFSGGFGSGAARITSVSIRHPSGDEKTVYRGGERVCVEVCAAVVHDLERPILGFLVKDRLGQDLFGENTLVVPEMTMEQVAAGRTIRARFHFKLPMLPNGQYSVMASVATGDAFNHVQHHYLHDALILTVSSAKIRWGLVGIEFEHVSFEVADGR